MLNGHRVLVTRPEPDNKKLCEIINTAGGVAISFPTIEIISLEDQPEFQNTLEQIPEQDLLIFISPNAARIVAPFVRECRVAAVGEGTAATLNECGISVDFVPKENWSSEGLLSLPELQKIKEKKIMLVCGEGGRELLAQTLKKRGAIVTHLRAYRRVMPTKKLLAHDVDVIVCTSNEGLQNFVTLLGKKSWQQFPRAQLLLISQRMVELARSLHFQGEIILAKNAGNKAILAALELLTMQQNSSNTPTQKSRPLIRIAMGFSFFGVIVLLFVMLWAGFSLYQIDLNLGMAINNLQKNVTEHQADFAVSAKNFAQVQTEIQALQQSMQAMRQTQQPNKLQWKIAEAHYLVELADARLQFTHSVTRATAMLDQAEKLLQDLPDPKILPLRKALADDRLALKNVAVPDLQNLYLKLLAISEHIPNLPLSGGKLAKSTQSLNESIDANLPWWRRGLQESGEMLKKIVVVRHMDISKLPLMPPEQQLYFFQNLQAQLSIASWALLHREPVVYEKSLAQTIAWIKQYVILSAPLTRSMLEDLTALSQTKIDPALPKLESPQAFQNYATTNDVSEEQV